MLTVFRHHGEVVVQCSGCNEDVRITDELSCTNTPKMEMNRAAEPRLEKKQGS